MRIAVAGTVVVAETGASGGTVAGVGYTRPPTSPSRARCRTVDMRDVDPPIPMATDRDEERARPGWARLLRCPALSRSFAFTLAFTFALAPLRPRFPR